MLEELALDGRRGEGGGDAVGDGGARGGGEEIDAALAEGVAVLW